VAAGAEAVLFREQGRAEDEIVASVADLIRKLFSTGQRRRVLVIKSEGIEIPCTRLARGVQQKLSDLTNIEIRATVLGHIVRGGRPSYQDRMISGRLGLAALNALCDGAADAMVSWHSPIAGGTRTSDPQVGLFPLAKVVEESQRLLDGTSPVSQWRVKIMENLEGVLPL
jgi:6-phosphofructokinase 1